MVLKMTEFPLLSQAKVFMCITPMQGQALRVFEEKSSSLCLRYFSSKNLAWAIHIPFEPVKEAETPSSKYSN